MLNYKLVTTPLYEKENTYLDMYKWYVYIIDDENNFEKGTIVIAYSNNKNEIIFLDEYKDKWSIIYNKLRRQEKMERICGE